MFRIEGLLGEGGTAFAYFAMRESPEGRSPAVIKIIHPHIAAECGERAAMIIQKEAVALGRLNETIPPTPFVVRFLDTGTLPYHRGKQSLQLPWLAIEYVHGGVEGTTLENRVDYAIRQTGYAFDAERVARALEALGSGLNEIHRVGVVHRDFTPGNVLCCGVGASEVFKISDFGIARPMGLAQTFGNMLLGTPGYVAPEQAFSDSGTDVGAYTDIFSLACVVFYILTGQHYFRATSASEAMLAARSEARRSIRESQFLWPELRADDAACDAIDIALARASHIDVNQRPPHARLFTNGLIPWLTDNPRTVRPNRMLLDSYMRLRPSDTLPGWAWNVRHPPGGDMVISSVAWDGDGHCLAVTTDGLIFWNGIDWTRAPTDGLPVREGIRFVERTQPGRWLVCSDQATIAELSRDGVGKVVQGPDPSLSIAGVSGDLGDLAVVLAHSPDSPPILYGVAGGHWLKPLVVDQASYVSSVRPLDSERWLVVGRSVAGTGFAAIYAPLQWELRPLQVPPMRALIQCASHLDRGIAIAVGGEGVIIRLEPSGMTNTLLEGQPSLTATAIDALDREWAGGAGRMWASPGGAQGWRLVYEDPAWQAPFVSILADVGLVVAVTVDGGVLESRSRTLDEIAQPRSV